MKIIYYIMENNTHVINFEIEKSVMFIFFSGFLFPIT